MELSCLSVDLEMEACPPLPGGSNVITKAFKCEPEKPRGGQHNIKDGFEDGKRNLSQGIWLGSTARNWILPWSVQKETHTCF